MDERSELNQVLEQRVVLCEAINREFKKRFPDPFYNPLFPISQSSHIWVKDNSRLYGNLETTYQLGELSLVDLEAFLKNGVLARKVRLEERFDYNLEYDNWERRNRNKQPQLQPDQTMGYRYSPPDPPPPKELRRQVNVPYPIAQVALNFLSGELKLGFVDHARGVESERIAREFGWRRSRFADLIPQADTTRPRQEDQQAVTRVNPGKEGQGENPGVIQLFKDSGPGLILEVYDTRDKTTRRYRFLGKGVGDVQVYLAGSVYIVEHYDGNWNKLTDTFPVEFCKLSTRG